MNSINWTWATPVFDIPLIAPVILILKYSHTLLPSSYTVFDQNSKLIIIYCHSISYWIHCDSLINIVN